MAVVTTNLGVITAYGDAVAAGYRGTKAEWQALMANYATVGQQAAQDAQTASQAAQTATTKAGEASASADRAEEAADSITTPDATLTQAGVAADAKATGDEITELKSGLKELPNIKESDAENVSLDISDKNGYVVMRLTDGEIKTKNFDSTNVNSDIAGLKTGKVNTAQGTENSGKILGVGSDGNIALINPSEQAETPTIETFLKTVDFVTGTAINIAIDEKFNKGDRVLFHVEDGYKNYEAGALATYYENGRKIVESRRGSNGYYEYVVTADDATLSIRIPASGYSDNRQVTLFVYRINGEVKPKIVTVDANGKGMFTTLRGAIDSITDANAYTNPYVIEVYPGTYDVLADYTDEEISAVENPYTQTSFVGPKLTDGMSIKGVGGTRDDIILTSNLDPDKWDSSVRGQVSTLNLQGSGSMENLTVLAYNIRYCVHDDFRNPSNQKTFRRLKNLKFGGSLTNNPKFSTYGSGMSTPRDYIIEDCDFGYVLGIHGNTNYSFPCHIKLDNCSGYAFVIGDYADEDTDAVINVEVNNCNFERIYINRHTVLTHPHVRLYGVGNEQSMVVADAVYPYYFGNVLLVEAGFALGSVLAHRANGDMFDLTDNADIMCGVVVYADSDYSYVVRNGYIQADRIGLSNLSIGDYVTIDSTTKKVVSGGTSANAVGVVTHIDATGSAFIRLRG